MSCVFFSSRRRHTSGALVTGVQTCALPIFERLRAGEPNDSDMMTRLVATGLLGRCDGPTSIEPASVEIPSRDLAAARYNGFRSEERRVGKDVSVRVDLGGRRSIKNKNTK